jgi:hypothetical protein
VSQVSGIDRQAGSNILSSKVIQRMLGNHNEIIIVFDGGIGVLEKGETRLSASAGAGEYLASQG